MWAIFSNHRRDEGEERTWQRPACLYSKQTQQIPTKLPVVDSSHVCVWNCWVSWRSHKYSVCVVPASYTSGAHPQHQQWLTWWCLDMIGIGSKSVASILNNLLPDQTAELLGAQDTTSSCKCILSTSAGPRRQGQRVEDSGNRNREQLVPSLSEAASNWCFRWSWFWGLSTWISGFWLPIIHLYQPDVWNRRFKSYDLEITIFRIGKMLSISSSWYVRAISRRLLGTPTVEKDTARDLFVLEKVDVPKQNLLSQTGRLFLYGKGNIFCQHWNQSRKRIPFQETVFETHAFESMN